MTEISQRGGVEIVGGFGKWVVLVANDELLFTMTGKKVYEIDTSSFFERS
jgi:hypothetical protein